MNKNLKWNAIHDLDDEDGNVTCWATELNPSQFPYGKYIWITEQYDGFHVEYLDTRDFITLKVLKSCASAKRWVKNNIKV